MAVLLHDSDKVAAFVPVSFNHRGKTAGLRHAGYARPTAMRAGTAFASAVTA